MEVTRTQAVANFLGKMTHPDLAELYSFNMEVQVNVAQDGGERIEGEYNGRNWSGWSDGLTTWKPFRIPYNANKNPEYSDVKMSFDLARHTEAIGLTGWDWANKCSRWVAFDFDSILNHAAGLSPDELDAIIQSVHQLSWVTIRRSTSGNGYHLYVMLPEVPTETHTEHAALARAILGKMSALAGTDFQSKVDGCGGNMWIWHRKMAASGGQGLKLVKQGGMLADVPANWKDHLQVVSGSRRKNLPQDIKDAEVFDMLSGQRSVVKLDEEHKKLIKWLEDTDAFWWWDNDNQMLVTHTLILKKAHEFLDLCGIFETNTHGTNLNEQNCFCFPMRNGVWAVRRFTPGVQEAKTWEQDGQGWTRCFLNRQADFTTACRTYNGVKDPKGAYVFREAVEAMEALKMLGITPSIGNRLHGRKTKLKLQNDEVIIEIDKEPSDPSDDMNDWLNEKNKPWTRVTRPAHRAEYEPETLNYDDSVRHLVSQIGMKDMGWSMKANNLWQEEPKSNIKDYLKSRGHKATDADIIIGTQISRPWTVVCLPFQPEFPGNREWNRGAAQLRYQPSKEDELVYPTWNSVLQRCGNGLDDAVLSDGWCRANGIVSGAAYLRCWIASLFQHPERPLPYLFLFGPQNSGKSVFFESISTLLKAGSVDASAAMTSQMGFNKELEGKILCYIDEKDLQAHKQAYNRIKEWVTARELLIHGKGETPYTSPNYTHWVHCANDARFCPVFTGDTRITMVYVDQLDPTDMVNKEVLFAKLEKEAPDFLASVLHLEIPASNDRLGVPVVSTSEKSGAQEGNKTELQVFIDEKCQYAPGYSLLYSDFFDKFQRWIDPAESHHWTKIILGKQVQAPYVKARMRGTAQFHIGNIAWRDEDILDRAKYSVDSCGYLMPGGGDV